MGLMVQVAKTRNRRVPALVCNRKDGSILVRVPEGDFVMGDGTEGDNPEHRVWLDAFYIGLFCVTNGQYARFVREGGGRAPDNTLWQRPERQDHPVVNVSWEDASAYATWAGLSLPTEAQWERAARGPLGLTYPWGQDFAPDRCCFFQNKGPGGMTVSVGAHAEGVSGYGTWQQAGNVWEWCSDWYDSDYYKASPQSNPQGPDSGDLRVNRGGSWDYSAGNCRAAVRDRLAPGVRCRNLGFRLARGSVR